MAAEGNAAIIAAIGELSSRCAALLVSIDGKETMESFRYLVVVKRSPVVDGLHVTGERQAAPVRAGGEGERAWRIEQRADDARAGSWLEVETPSFDVTVEPVVLKTGASLARRRFALDVKPIKDFFNDKLDYT